MKAGLTKGMFLFVALTWFSQSVNAQCVDKKASQSGFDEKQATSLAWETILREIDWQLQIKWLSDSLPAGVAPGYRVNNYRVKCAAGGDRGHVCTASATICK